MLGRAPINTDIMHLGWLGVDVDDALIMRRKKRLFNDLRLSQIYWTYECRRKGPKFTKIPKMPLSITANNFSSPSSLIHVLFV